MERRKGKSIKNKCLYAVDRSLTERYQRSSIPNVWRKIKNSLMEQGQLTNMIVTSGLWSIWSYRYVRSISCNNDNNNNNNKGTERHDSMNWHVWYLKYRSEKRSYTSITKYLLQNACVYIIMRNSGSNDKHLLWNIWELFCTC